MSTNKISSSGSAVIHAYNEVMLMHGFDAVSGSEVHIYNAPCNSGFNRTSLPMDTSNINTIRESEVNTNFISPMPNNALGSQENSENPMKKRDINLEANEKQLKPPTYLNGNTDYKIIPNPTNGRVSIFINETSKKPLDISLLSALGYVLQEVNYIEANTYFFDLSQYPNGIYAIRIRFTDEIVTKSIIKQEK